MELGVMEVFNADWEPSMNGNMIRDAWSRKWETGWAVCNATGAAHVPVDVLAMRAPSTEMT